MELRYWNPKAACRRIAVVFLAVFTLGGLAAAQMFDQYGGYTGLKGSNTSGFFRVEKINGRYWLVTPENNVFWSTGICVLQYYDTWGGYCPVTGQYPNPYSNKAKYPGGISEWATVMKSRLDRWGFNTNACWGVANIANHTECIRDLSLNSRAPNYGCRMVTADFPDVWDPKWEITCDTVAKNQLSANKNNPWTIGSFPYNEVHWSNPYGGFKTLPDAYIALPPEAYGKRYWVNDFLKGKYATIADLNAAYGTNFASFDDLLSVTSLPDDAAYPARLNDKIDFMEAIADKYYSVCTYYMRKWDPNHLVFSTRWAMWWQGYGDPYTRSFNERIWRAAGRYCDVFANNGYVDFASVEANYQHCSRVFQNSKKPFIVTEHSALAEDSYFAIGSGWLATQMDRGNWYYDQVKKLLDTGVNDDPNDPGNPAKICMGIHWFQCYDEPSLGRPDGEKAQFGVFNCQDEAFLPFVEMAATVNSQIYNYAVNGTPFDIPAAPTAVSPIAISLQQSEKASSFERVTYSNDPDYRHSTGSLVDDPAARKGKAWCATTAGSTANVYMVYGPYWPAKSLWPGTSCSVTFRLKVSDNTSANNVAKIDVTSGSGAQVHASRDLKGTDFSAPNAYQDFTLTFTTPNPAPDKWEFRVCFYKVADVYVDTITVAHSTTSSYVAGPISDGVDHTVWSSVGHNSATATEWATIYLGSSAVQVDRLTVFSPTSTAVGMPIDFELQYSTDGSNWSTIPGQVYVNYTPHIGTHDFTFEPVTCKYLRLYATRLGQDSDGKYRLVLGGIDVTPAVQTATPTLRWTYNGTPLNYTLLLSPVAHFPEEQTIKIEGITGTSYTPTVPLAQGTWYWTVKATNQAGRQGKYLTTVKFDIGHLANSEFDHIAALRCERVCDWRNVSNRDTSGDGYSFAFLDNSIKLEGQSSLRVAITVNSLNKTTGQMNTGTSDVPFRYAGRALDCSGLSSFSFDIYPKRFCDTTATIVPSSKYVWFRMVDLSGNVVADQAVDPNGVLPIGQWSTVTVPLSGRRCQVTRIEFYVKAGASKLTWDERVFFNIDNLTQAPVADMTPPSTPNISSAGYTIDGNISAFIASEDPESGVVEYRYAIGSAPGLDDIVGWKSNGASPNVAESGVVSVDGQSCYVSAKAVNSIGMESWVGTSSAITKVKLVAGLRAAKTHPMGSWIALRDQVVTASFPGRFYVEQPDRSAGIGVLSTDSVTIGDRVTVYGQTQVLGHEAVISGHAADTRAGEPLEPVAMTNASTGGGSTGIQEAPTDDAGANRCAVGLSNVGCLVRTFGNASYVDPTGEFFYLDDGSGISDGSGYTGIRVLTSGLLVPVEETFARVTGILGVTDLGGRCIRLLRPRAISDLVYERTANYVLNPGFESGVLSPWVTAGTPGQIISGTYYFSIVAQSGNFFFAQYGNYATKSGTIYQVASVKPGASYSASVWSRVLHGGNTQEAAKNRIGIDPTGGTDPASPNIIWSDWDSQSAWYYSEWHRISTPIAAVLGDRVTVFLEYLQQETPGWHINCFDDAVLEEIDQP